MNVCASCRDQKLVSDAPAARLTGSYVPFNVSSGNQNFAFLSSNMQS